MNQFDAKRILQKFSSDWDKTIAEWHRHPFRRDCLAEEDARLFSIVSTLMPEPYWGNLLSSSVVVANLNPGGGEEPNWNTPHGRALCWFMDHVKPPKLYSSFAKKGPVFLSREQLQRKNFGQFGDYAGWKWWNERSQRPQWANRIVRALSRGRNVGQAPVALELCGWHSSGWARNLSRLEANERQFFLQKVVNPFHAAVRVSRFRLGLCVGRPWSDLLRTLDSEGKSLFGFRTISDTHCLLDDGSRRNHEMFEWDDGSRAMVTWQSDRTSEKPDIFLPPDESFLANEIRFLSGERCFPVVQVSKRATIHSAPSSTHLVCSSQKLVPDTDED